MKGWLPDINWQIGNFGKILIVWGIVTLIGVLIILNGCVEGTGPPSVKEAAYKIIWYDEMEGKDIFVFTDNYELGNSVVVKGYWEKYNEPTWKLKEGYDYRYKNDILVLDATSVVIRDRRK